MPIMKVFDPHNYVLGIQYILLVPKSFICYGDLLLTVVPTMDFYRVVKLVSRIPCANLHQGQTRLIELQITSFRHHLLSFSHFHHAVPSSRQGQLLEHLSSNTYKSSCYQEVCLITAIQQCLLQSLDFIKQQQWVSYGSCFFCRARPCSLISQCGLSRGQEARGVYIAGCYLIMSGDNFCSICLSRHVPLGNQDIKILIYYPHELNQLSGYSNYSPCQFSNAVLRHRPRNGLNLCFMIL